MSVRHLLARHNLIPKRSLGQNFMVSEGALNRLADAALLAPGDVIIEVGAGLGHLTEVLAERVGQHGRIIAVEIDQRLMPLLRIRLARTPWVEPILADALTLNPGALLGDLPYKVAATCLTTSPRPSPATS